MTAKESSAYIGKEVGVIECRYSVFPRENRQIEPLIFRAKLMAVADGYAMLRRKSCVPFVCSLKEITP
jgi:hypothetical protein